MSMSTLTEKREGNMQGPGLAASFVLLITAALSSPDSVSTSENGESSETEYMSYLTTTSVLAVDTIPTKSADLTSYAIIDGEEFGSGFEQTTPSFDVNSTQNGSSENTDTDIYTILTFGIPALVLLLLIVVVIALVICRKRKKFTPENSETEDFKSPIFEDDLPSVMEIEMEELDEWMNSLNKNAESAHPPSKEDGKAPPVITSRIFALR
ncbi:transmembrane protein 154 isoform X2 [Lissotriton helveticus]